MIPEYSITKDGLFDANGKSISIEEVISAHTEQGGFVSKTCEDRTVFKVDEDGNLVRERKFCEVYHFEK